MSEDELDPAERMLVVLTREDGKNADMQAMLSQFGIDSLVLPLIRTEELPAARELAEAVRELPDGSWVCLTSAIAALTLCAHALEPLAERWAREEVRVAVVGVATGRALEERSGGRVVADFVPSTANARTLGVELPLYGRTPGESGETKAGGKTEGGRSTGEAMGQEAKARGSSGGDSGIPEAGAGPPKAAPDLGSDSDTDGAPRSAPHVLFPASRLALGLLERILRERGAAVRRMEVYGTFPQVVDDARLIRRASLADAVVLASPSAAKCVRTADGDGEKGGACARRSERSPCRGVIGATGGKGGDRARGARSRHLQPTRLLSPLPSPLPRLSRSVLTRLPLLPSPAGLGSRRWVPRRRCGSPRPASGRRRRKQRRRQASGSSSRRTSPARAPSWSSSSGASPAAATRLPPDAPTGLAARRHARAAREGPRFRTTQASSCPRLAGTRRSEARSNRAERQRA